VVSEPEPRYDAALITKFFDDYGSREWDRLERTPADRVNFEVHRRLLGRFVKQGDRVLEIGAGPGRFTIELSRIGARVVVTDISAVQLNLNRERVRAAGAEAAVTERAVVDVLDLSRYRDDEFDVLVAYGGPLSYVLERADEAVRGMLRVTRPGGLILCSVMTLLGTARVRLGDLFALVDAFGLPLIDREVRTGDLTAETVRGQSMRLYRAKDFRELLIRNRAEVVEMWSANYLSLGNDTLLATLASDAERWNAFLEWEIAACAEPGALDGGTHMIAVVRRPS
jgi:ubiquinone/menaquinone biosynthesis C-methylase UbiE